MSDLREKVALAMWYQGAGAAIAICLEEAARVARSKEDEWMAEWRAGLKADSHLEGKADGAGEVADAIMALIPAKPDSAAS